VPTSWSPGSGGPAGPTDAAVKHALELEWHEAHPDAGADERISRYKKLVLRRLRERQWALLGSVAGKRALDVGCGVGRETVELARRGATVVGVDLSPAVLERARARTAEAGVTERVELRVAAAETLAQEGERFDVVIGNGILHHVDLRAFQETLPALLRPDGVAQFVEPLAHNPLLRIYRRLTPALHSPTEQPLTQADVRALTRRFRRASVDYVNLAGLLLLPAPYVVGGAVADMLLGLALRADRALFAVLPALARYSQYVVIQLGAPS
jgi:SAM-dependent methyltransferase